MIAGADASTSSFGLARPDGSLVTIKPRNGAGDVGRRLDELRRRVELELRTHPPMPRLVLVEGYSLGSPGRLSLVRLGELGGVLRLRLFELDIPYVEIPPTQLKRYATGNGQAGKEAMIAAAVALGAEPRNDDEADAFLLRHLGRAAYDMESTTEPHRLEILASLTWPRI